MNNLQPWPKIVFFDGFCVLCNRTVDFLIKRDKKGLYKFASLQAEIARSFLPADLTRMPGYDSVVLLDNGVIYTHSTAIIKIMANLPFPWDLFTVFRIIPVKIRDHIYRYIARNRYSWFGRNTQCRMPHDHTNNRIIA